MCKEFNIIANSSNDFQIPNVKNLIALDGAADLFYDQKLVPLAVIGDMDSVKDETLQFFKSKNCQIIKISDQDTTDLEKAIYYCKKLHADKINILNAHGSRVDHTLYSLRLLKKFYSKDIKIEFKSRNESIQYYEDCTVEIEGKMGDIISIISAPHATINSIGLKYEMQNQELSFGRNESISNQFAKTEAKIVVQGGVFLIKELNIPSY